MSTLDILEELLARASITMLQWRTARHQLRSAGASIMPVQVAELAHAAERTGKLLSAEMRSIQISLNLARAARMPGFPREVPWFARTSIAVKSALLEVWKTQKDIDRASSLSSILWNLAPKPEEWVDCWLDGPPPDWCQTVAALSFAGLCLPVELDDAGTLKAYNEWVERELLDPLRILRPALYQAIVRQLEVFIESGIETYNEN